MKPAQKLPESENPASDSDAAARGKNATPAPGSRQAAGADPQAAEDLNNPATQQRYEGRPGNEPGDERTGDASSTPWVETPLGKLIDMQEPSMVAASLPRLYNPVCVQIGSLGGRDLMGSTEAALKVVIANAQPSNADSDDVVQVKADPTALPFGERSVDLALLVHALDFSSEPHQVLREIDQTLAPDGHVVILGFNPLSLFGLRRLVSRLFRRGRNTPWSGSWLRLSRVQDWLTLLGYESTAGVRSVYVPPFQSQRIVDRFEFMEKAGNRWWPRFGAVYVIVARKREIVGTVLPAWQRKRRKLGQQLTSPVTRGAGTSTQSTNKTIIRWPHPKK